MPYPYWKLGLFQAVGLIAYIALFSLAATLLSQYVVPPAPFVAIILGLLAFVFSALVSGSIVLGYPLFLALNGEKRAAIRILVWSIFWIALLLLVVFTIAMFTMNRAAHLYGA